MNPSLILQLVSLPNIAAFLRVVRQTESSQNDDKALHMLVYGGRFESLADHPRVHFDIKTHQRVDNWRAAPPNSTTSAAGMPMITETSWDRFCRAIGRKIAFDAVGQTAYVVWALNERGALADVRGGNLSAAIDKCNREWTSLPGGPESKPSWTLSGAVQVFRAYGGTFDPGRPADPPPPPAVPPGPTSQAPDPSPAPAAPRVETYYRVPDAEVAALVAQIHAVGGDVRRTQQPDGTWTVTATYGAQT